MKKTSESFISRFVTSIVSVGMGNLSVMILGLLGTMIMARYLPAETFGTFVLVQIIANFLMRFSGFGLNLALSKYVTSAETQHDKYRLISTALLFRFMIFPVIGLIALLIEPALAALFDIASMDNLYLYFMLLFLLGSVSQLLKAALQGLFLFNVIAKVDFINATLGFVLLLAFVVGLDKGLMGLVLAKALPMVIANSYAFLALSPKYRFRFDFGMLKRMLTFGFPLQLNDILTFIFLRMDTLMIGALLGPAQIAYYEIARKIPESIAGLYDAFRSVFFPYVAKFFAEDRQDKATLLINTSLRLITFACILGALIALLFGREIILILFSEKYLVSAPIFVLLMLGLSITFADYTMGYSLVAIGDSDKPIYINVVHTAVSLLGNLIFIPIFGIVGAALASLAGFIAANPLNVLFLRRRNLKVKVGNYVRPIAVFGVCWLLTQLVPVSTVTFRVAILIIGIVLSMALSVITIADFNIVFREIRVFVARSRLSMGPSSS